MKQNRFYIFCALATLFAGRLTYASDLANKQVVNLVICNDCSEERFDEGATVGFDLMQALMDKQLVLCTKKVFNNLSIFYESFKNNKTLRELQSLTNQYGNNLNVLHNKLLEKFSNFRGYHYKLALATAYEIFLAYDYICKDVSSDYILFIPPYESSEQLQAGIIFEKYVGTKIETLGFSLQDLQLGMHVSQLKGYDYKKPINCYFDSSVGLSDSKNQNGSCVPCSDEALVVSTLKSLGLKQLVLRTSPDKKDVIDECLPRMNIMLMGHGAYKGKDGLEEFDIIAGIPVDSTNAKSSNNFDQFLRCLNDDYVVQSLSLFTCFGGFNVNKMLQAVDNKTLFAQATYPVLCMSGIFTISTGRYSDLYLDISLSELSDYVYKVGKTYFYGPRRLFGEKGIFVQFFEHLNHVETYNVKDQKTGAQKYFYTAYKPEWKKAIDTLTGLFETSYVERLENLTFVKFPGTPALSLPELDSRIMSITPIKAASAQAGLSVPENVSIVMLQASYVPYVVTLQNKMLGTKEQDVWIVPTIIGKNVGDTVDYCFEEIKCSGDINSLGRLFFNYDLLSCLAQSFTVLIKKAYCGNKVYSDVIFAYKYIEAGYMLPEADSAQGDDLENGGSDWVDESRFAIAIYKDNDGNIKRFVYRGHDPEWEQITLGLYTDKTIQMVYQNAQQGLQETRQKVDVLNSLFGKGAQSAQEVKKQQEFRAQKAKQEDPRSAAIPQIYPTPKIKPGSVS